MKLLKRAAALLMSAVLCAWALPAAASAVQFSDVPRTHWACQDIRDLQSRGLLQGSGGKFRPQEPMSRQAFLSMVCRAAGLDDRSLQSGSSWADPAMAYAFYLGWYDEGEFTAVNRAKPISRDLAAKLLVNALFPGRLEPAANAPTFTDQEEIGRTRLPYVRTAAALGLMSGYNDGRFDPNGNLTRAAAAAVLHRALSLREQNRPAPGPSIQVPILMYHDISYLGKGYSQTPEVFRRQMMELKAAGFHTVSYAELVDYVERDVPLPAKPIVITLDDGYHTNYEYAYPILKELGMKAEISLIGNAIQYSGWGLKWDEVREMTDSGLISFQAHTMAMHSDNSAQGGRLGVLKTDQESWAEYVETLGADTTAILDVIKEKTGHRPIAFTYPRGKWNPMAEALVTSLGCKLSVTTKNGVATITQGNPISLHLMDRVGMDFQKCSVVEVLTKLGYKG